MIIIVDKNSATIVISLPIYDVDELSFLCNYLVDTLDNVRAGTGEKSTRLKKLTFRVTLCVQYDCCRLGADISFALLQYISI